MVTQDSWMFLGAYSKYRSRLLARSSLMTLAHLGTSAFDTIGGEVVSTIAFVSGASNTKPRAPSSSAPLTLMAAPRSVVKQAASGRNPSRVWVRSVSEFLDVPSTPVVYWATDDEIAALRRGALSGRPRQLVKASPPEQRSIPASLARGLLRQIGFGIDSTDESVKSGARWFPYQKGGSSRRWYGNFDYVVDWENDGARARANVVEETGRVRSHNYNGAFGFKRGFTWSGISGDGFAVRHVDGGFMFDAKGPMAFANSEPELLCP